MAWFMLRVRRSESKCCHMYDDIEIIVVNNRSSEESYYKYDFAGVNILHLVILFVEFFLLKSRSRLQTNGLLYFRSTVIGKIHSPS